MSLLRLPAWVFLLVRGDNTWQGSPLRVFDAPRTTPIALKHPYLYVRQLESLPAFAFRVDSRELALTLRLLKIEADVDLQFLFGAAFLAFEATLLLWWWALVKLATFGGGKPVHQAAL